jgi:mycothiol synthase
MTWQTGLDPDIARELTGLAELVLLVDGVAPLSGHVVEAIATGQDGYFLLRTGGDLAGVAVAHDGDPAELFVAPGQRRRGFGTQLLNAALSTSGAVWAHGDLPAARAVASKLGLVVTRELLQMRHELDPIWVTELLAEAPLPPGIRLRTFEPGRDEQQFLSVNARAFAWHPEQGRLDRAGLAIEMAQPWFDADGFFLAVDEHDTVLGFHWTKVHPASSTADAFGEVYVIGVDPDATVAGRPVRGLGAPLTAAGLAHLAARHLKTVSLYAEGDNAKALKLYRGLGFETFSRDVVYRRPY